MPAGRRVRLGACLIAPLALLALAGCASSGSSDDHQRAVAVQLMEEAQTEIGGSWTVADGGAGVCALPGGGRGTSFPLRRTGPAVPVHEQQATIDRIEKDWSAAGLGPVAVTRPTASGITSIVVRYPSSGVTADGFFIQASVSVAASSVRSRSGCGNADPLDKAG